MPPRPAPGSARRGSSQRQGSDEERTVKLLERLAGAADLGAFVLVHFEEVCCLHGIGPVLRSSVQSGATAAAGSPGHALLAAWMAAIARGMQLAAQQLDLSRLRQHSEQVDLLSSLVGAISNCLVTLKAEGAAASDDGKEAMRVALSALAVRAGVVKAHKQLSLRLTSIIRHPQQARSSSTAAAAAQQQQQQQMEPVVARLVAHLELFGSMGDAWPGGFSGLFSSSLCQALPAAAGFAVAVLRHREVIVTYPGELITTWLAAWHTAAVLCNAYECSSGRSVPAQVVGSSVATLLLLSLGLAAQRLHQLRRGLSPAAVGTAQSAAAAGAATAQQQRLAVPAHHTKLQQALGVAVGGAHPESLLAAQGVALWTRAVDGLLGQKQQPLLADAAAAASCQLPLLLVLMECLLLEPTQHLVSKAVFVLHQALTSSEEQTTLQLAPMLRAILEQDDRRRALEAAAPAAGAGETAGNMSAWEVLARLVMAVTRAVVWWAVDSAPGDEAAIDRLLAGVAAVWLEHPAQYASLLEAGLRPKPTRHLLPCAVASSTAVLVAARARASAGSSALAADSQQQVFALLLSCLKAVTAVTADGSSAGAVASDAAQPNSEHARIFAVMPAAVLQSAVGGCRRLVASSSSSISSGASNQTSMAAPAAAAAGLSAQQACVLLARCLVAAGRLLQQQALAPASDVHPLLHAAKRAVTPLVQQLAHLEEATAAAAEPWLQQLQDEHTQLAQQLQTLAQMAAAASGGANPLRLPAAALAGVAKQLQAFGATVCAAVPVQQCCNHPDCRNLEQASELELVGGKTCVCGGCRVARYCSRECQVAHYKGWHKAVCKRLQAQQQQREEHQAEAVAAQEQQQ